MSVIPPLLGQLSDDLLLACGADGRVHEANAHAISALGADPTGRPLLELLAARARDKGCKFIDALAALPTGALSADWELLLHLPAVAPLLVTARGTALAGGGWLILARSETSRLSPLYYEALAINADLTSLVRRLTRENAALAARLARMESEEHTRDVA